MIVQQLAAQVTLPDGEAIVRAVKGGEVIAPVDVVALYGIREALGIKHNLVQFETIRVEIIRLGRITACGGAQVQSWIDPAINLCAAFCLVDRGYQRIAVCIWLSDDGRTSIRPI